MVWLGPMSRQGKGAHTVRLHVQRGPRPHPKGSMYDEIPFIMGNGHIGPPQDILTD